MTTPDTQELIEALGPFATFAEHAIDERGWIGGSGRERICDWFGPSEIRRAREALSRARSADEQHTPPADLAEVVARIIDPDAWHETLPTDGCGVYWIGRRNKARSKAQAVLQALSPHLSEREKIVVWLLRHYDGELSANFHTQQTAKLFADATSRGDHISGEGR